MFESYFSNTQLIFLIIAICLISAASFLFQFSKQKKIALIIVFTGIFCLRIFDILLDPFLNYWDEQFHALVAKNLSNNFFKPVLYPKDLLPYDFRRWTGNYIWVHKQPFFLWEMATSIKIFGPTIFAVRFPSAISLVFTAFCIFKIGKNFVNEYVGYYAAVLFSFSFYIGEFCTGATATDHNDVAFITYVTASIWALSEHIISPEKKKWIYIIGVFSGVAILNKWLVGLLVYSGWVLYLIISSQKNNIFKWKRFKKLVISLIITVIIAAPWQIYCLLRFPTETKYEMAFNSKHLTEAVEGHGGDGYFYYDSLFYTYGKFSPLFILLGIVLLLTYVKKKEYFYTSLILFFVTYLFYIIVATKMFGFTMIVCFFIYLGFGAILYHISTFLGAKTKKIIVPIILLTAGIFHLRIEEKQLGHSDWKKNPIAYYNRKNQEYWKNYCNQLDSLMPNKNYVLFNCPDLQEFKLMFYSNYLGYWGFPSQTQIDILKKNGYSIAIYDDGNLESWVYNQKDYFVISDKSRKTVKIDTVFLKGRNLNNIYLNYDLRLACSQPTNGEGFILRTYADGTSSLRNLYGNFISVSTIIDGDVFCNKNKLNYSERFYIEKNREGYFTLTTIDGQKLKCINNGTSIVSCNGAFGVEEFEIIPLKKS